MVVIDKELTSVSKRVENVPPSGIRKMFNIAQKYGDTINLSIGEPDFNTPSNIIEAALRAMKNGYTHYTPNAGLLQFREAVSEKLRKENKIDADPDTEIIATVGAQGASSLTMLTMINPGDEVLIPDPGYASYEAQVLLADGKPVSYPLKEVNCFSIDSEEVKNLVTSKTRAIMINSPSNPTGAMFSERDLRDIANIALQHNLLVISDEAYEAILYDGVKHTSIASLPEMKQQTVSIFTFSKTYAMTGWRIGFAVANEKIIAEMTKLQEHISAHPSSISQMAAIAALKDPKNHVKMMVKEYAERREIILHGLSEIEGVKCLKPKGAFYVFPRITSYNMSSNDFVMHLLEKAKVITVPGTAFGEYGEGYVRISYATSREKIAEAMSRMRKALQVINRE